MLILANDFGSKIESHGPNIQGLLLMFWPQEVKLKR